MRLLLTGVTGVAGLNIYRAAVADPTITSITLLSRRELPSWAVVPANATEKTTTILHPDFTSYTPELASRLVQHDACIWTIGKSSLGVSEADYTSYTYDAPMAFLKALKDAEVGKGREKDKPFRFLYFSGLHADPTQQSRQMWARVKGRAENDINALAKDTDGLQAVIVRPGYFRPSREFPQDWVNQRPVSVNYIDRVLGPVLNCLTPSTVSPLNELSRVTLEVAKGRWPDIDLLPNDKLRALAKEIGA